MKNLARKLMPLAAALGLAFAATASHAAEVLTDFNLKTGPMGTTIFAGASALDWNETGSGVAKGVGPFQTVAPLPMGGKFEFLYQANLATVSKGVGPGEQAGFTTLDTTSDGIKNDGKAFEYTIVAKLQEVVSFSTNIPGGAFASFDLDTTSPKQSKVAIFFDTAANANTAAGTGFDDGTMIALLTIIADGTTSSFTRTNAAGTTPANGQGAAKIHAVIDSAAGDFVNANYLEGISELIFGMKFQSNLNYPAGTSDTVAFHAGAGEDSLFAAYTVDKTCTATPGSCDILFKVDGSNQFTAQVPEPGSMMLLGIGLMGAVAATRRRKQVKG